MLLDGNLTYEPMCPSVGWSVGLSVIISEKDGNFTSSSYCTTCYNKPSEIGHNINVTLEL